MLLLCLFRLACLCHTQLDGFVYARGRTRVEVNHASAEELAQLGLTDYQIQALQKHIQETGPLLSLYELQVIDGWDLPSIRALLPFLYIRKEEAQPIKLHPVWEGKLSSSWKPLFPMQCASQLGCHVDPYVDSLFQIPKHDYISVLSFLRPLDPWRGYVRLRSLLGLSQLIVGDYQLALGEGVALGKSPSSSPYGIHLIKTAHMGLEPFLFASGERGLRGVAAAKTIAETHTLYAFASFGSFDGIFVESSGQASTGRPHPSSSSSGGGPLANPTTDQRHACGVAWRYAPRQRNQLRLGGQLLYADSLTKKKTLNMPSQACMASGYGSGIVGNTHFFGECAMQLFAVTNPFASSPAFGGVCGGVTAVGPLWDIAYACRRYSPHFCSPFSGAICSNNECNNEQGIYVAIRCTPTKRLAFMYSQDYFQPVAPAGTRGAFSTGVHLLKVTYRAPNQWLWRWQCKLRHNVKGVKEFFSLASSSQKHTLSCRFPLYRSLNGKAELSLAQWRDAGVAINGGGLTFNMHYKQQKNSLSGFFLCHYTPSAKHKLYLSETYAGRSYKPFSGLGCKIGLSAGAQTWRKMRVQLHIEYACAKTHSVGWRISVEYRGNQRT